MGSTRIFFGISVAFCVLISESTANKSVEDSIHENEDTIMNPELSEDQKIPVTPFSHYNMDNPQQLDPDTILLNKDSEKNIPLNEIMHEVPNTHRFLNDSFVQTKTNVGVEGSHFTPATNTINSRLDDQQWNQNNKQSEISNLAPSSYIDRDQLWKAIPETEKMPSQNIFFHNSPDYNKMIVATSYKIREESTKSKNQDEKQSTKEHFMTKPGRPIADFPGSSQINSVGILGSVDSSEKPNESLIAKILRKKIERTAKKETKLKKAMLEIKLHHAKKKQLKMKLKNISMMEIGNNEKLGAIRRRKRGTLNNEEGIEV